MPREWAPLVDDLREPPELEVLERREVDTMLYFSLEKLNFELINFDNIVMDVNMRDIHGYRIPENRIPFDKKGKSTTKKMGGSETTAPRQDAPKKGKEKKQGAPDKGRGKMSEAPWRPSAKDQEKSLQPTNKLMGDAIRSGSGDSPDKGPRVKIVA